METNTISKTELIEQQSDTFFIEKEKKDQKELTFVKPEVFKKMVTDQGISVDEFCQRGYKIVLFFEKRWLPILYWHTSRYSCFL